MKFLTYDGKAYDNLEDAVVALRRRREGVLRSINQLKDKQLPSLHKKYMEARHRLQDYRGKGFGKSVVYYARSLLWTDLSKSHDMLKSEIDRYRKLRSELETVTKEVMYCEELVEPSEVRR